jgi:hypothetical protein
MATRRSELSKQKKAETAFGDGEIDLSSILKYRGQGATTEEAKLLETEGILLSLHRPHQFITKLCKRKNCGNIFRTNFCGVAYCSDSCRVIAYRELGLRWAHRQEEYEHHMYSGDSGIMFRYEPPMTITPQALTDLEKACRAFLDDIDRLREEVHQRSLESLLETPESPALSLLADEYFDGVRQTEVPDQPDLEDSLVPTSLPDEPAPQESTDYFGGLFDDPRG